MEKIIRTKFRRNQKIRWEEYPETLKIGVILETPKCVVDDYDGNVTEWNNDLSIYQVQTDEGVIKYIYEKDLRKL